MSIIPVQLKFELMKRYKRCKICHSKEDLQFHHLIPELNEKDNFVRVCAKCHKRIHETIESQIKNAIQNAIENHKRQTNVIKPGSYKEQIIFNKFADLKKELLQRFEKLEAQVKAKNDIH
jgi:L-lactate utilization protein LutC